MKLRIQRAGLIKLIALVSLFTGLASANTIIMPTGTDSSRGGALWIKADNVVVQEGFVGVIFIRVTEGTHTFNRDSFCVDLFTGISVGTSYESTLLRPDEVPGKHLTRVSWLVDNALLPTYPFGYTSELKKKDWVTTSAQGMGLQLAIWDIVHDNGDGFTAGRVQKSVTKNQTTDATVLSWAQKYLDASASKTSDMAYVYDNVKMSNGQPAQMLVGPEYLDGGPAPVPEPSTLGLGGAATIAIVVSVRRKNRLKQAA